MLAFFRQWSMQRSSWLVLFAGFTALEIMALIFQHGMKLEPCVMCIYERVATLGIIASAAVGLIAPANWLVRNLALTGWGVSVIWGMVILVEHLQKQGSTSLFNVCESIPNFPAWMPLHEWMPSVFMPTGDCSDIAWIFLGLTMVQWLAIIFAVCLLLWVVVVISQFTRQTSHLSAAR